MRLSRIVSVIACVFVVGFIINVLSQQSGTDKELPPTPAIASVPEIYPETAPLSVVQEIIPVFPEPQYVEINGSIKNGDTFSKALSRQEQISSPVKQQIIQSLSACLDFRQLKPGDEYKVLLDEENNLVRCTYEAGPLETYVVEKDAGETDAFVSRKEAISLEVKTVHFAGEMQSSLFEAFKEIKENSKLVYAFADIFASQIDFNTEPRQYDRFEGVVEKYYKNDEFIGYGNIIYAKYEQQDGSVHEGFYYRGQDGIDGHFNLDGEELGTFFIKSPLPMGRVTSRFTWRRKHPISGVVKPHLGIDLAAPSGTPVIAASDGKVEFAGVNGGYGKQVILSHSGGYRTYYGHLSRYGKGLKKGSRVKQKQVIGYVGSTGISTGPHLDYRLKLGNQFLDPFAAKFKPRSILSGETFASFLKETESTSLFLVNREQNILSVEQKIVQPEETLSIL
ncbi:MAG: M23 family metallopeptidase [Desulfobulbaceae bacterium]|uniref:M23 family metallopeptidase n=1 Tax=Candidatus Desulfobia pelagia TaxID=2841692 RepID=A0A8J6NBI3_9BACT|nr:M23 family metallopeptidase [Candidatus Desulfobia pelagia]